jgi:Protein ENHANCED DISEASE RESISTANCE 2, C-terminal
MGKSSSDGGGYTVTMYYKLKASTRALLRKVTAGGYDGSSPEDQNDPRVNAVRLWEEWIRRAPSDPKFMARFKVVPLAHNLAEIGMPGWIAKYNGKPFLIKRAGVTGFIHTHPQLSCVEFDISLHPFPYLAKQGICFMKDSYFKRVLVTFGFVIEGRTDDELPETVIGCMQLCYPDPQYAIQAKDFFNGTAPRSIDTNTSTTDIDTTKKSTDTAVEDTTDS